jgi:hypothetical protein
VLSPSQKTVVGKNNKELLKNFLIKLKQKGNQLETGNKKIKIDYIFIFRQPYTHHHETIPKYES